MQATDYFFIGFAIFMVFAAFAGWLIYSVTQNSKVIDDREWGLIWRLGTLVKAVDSGWHFRLAGLYRITTLTKQVIDVPVEPVQVVIERAVELKAIPKLQIRVDPEEPRRAAILAKNAEQLIAGRLAAVISEVLGAETLEMVFEDRDDKNRRVNQLLAPYAKELGWLIHYCSIVNFEVPERLQQALLREIMARLDAQGDTITAHNEGPLADAYYKAAKRLMPDLNNPELQTTLAAMIRGARAAEDSANGTVVLGSMGSDIARLLHPHRVEPGNESPPPVPEGA